MQGLTQPRPTRPAFAPQQQHQAHQQQQQAGSQVQRQRQREADDRRKGGMKRMNEYVYDDDEDG